MEPIWIANLNDNVQAHKMGEPLQHIFTTPFINNFIYIGGAGATIGLVIALAWIARRKKASQRAKALSPITLIPGFFNINEPTMFGVPVVLNVLLIVPFILAPLMNLLISYAAVKVGILPLIYAEPGWTTPPIISGFLCTGSIMGSVVQIVLIVLDVLLYLPFILNLEKTFKKEEAKSEEK